jgi:hypothetical protein
MAQHAYNDINNITVGAGKTTLDVERTKGESEPISVQHMITSKAWAMTTRWATGCTTGSKKAGMGR